MPAPQIAAFDDCFNEHLLAAWLAEHGWPGASCEPLQGDVSPRRYLRVRGPGRGAAQPTAILALYPEAVRSSAARFLRSGELLAERGVRVPRVLAAELTRGMMLVEDLGRETLYERALDWPARAPWWHKAATVLTAVRDIETAEVAALNPALDAALLRREIEQTRRLVLEPALGGDGALLADTVAALDTVCETLDRDAAVACHRDFMARNLVPLEDGALAVLDHQDLRLGPPAYDWASLLNDSLFAPPALEEEILVMADRDAGVARAAYHRAAVQRGFKAAGTFVAFAQRGSDRHLALVPATLDRAVAHLRELPEGRRVAAALGRALERADLLQ